MSWKYRRDRRVGKSPPGHDLVTTGRKVYCFQGSGYVEARVSLLLLQPLPFSSPYISPAPTFLQPLPFSGHYFLRPIPFKRLRVLYYRMRTRPDLPPKAAPTRLEMGGTKEAREGRVRGVHNGLHVAKRFTEEPWVPIFVPRKGVSIRMYDRELWVPILVPREVSASECTTETSVGKVDPAVGVNLVRIAVDTARLVVASWTSS